MFSLRHLIRLALIASIVFSPLAAQSPRGQSVTLPGHVLPALSKATRMPRTPLMDQDPITVAVMLNLTGQAAYDAFRQDFNNPNSPNYHKTIAGSDFTSRFGPSPEAYSAVLNYFQQQGFALIVGSSNRRTLTFRATRVQGETAFNLKIDDYQIGSQTFHAIATDPALPPDLAPLVAGVSGLTTLSHWEPASTAPKPTPAGIAKAYVGAGGLPPGLDGTGQTIGILSFYDFSPSDISNWLSYAGLPASLVNNVSSYTVGIGSPLGNSVETVLDIDAALGMAPGAKIVVYIAPYYSGEYASDFYTPISAAIDNMWSTGGAISVSYGVCEAGISASDATNMDNLLESYTYIGVTLFAATGDHGSTCSIGSTAYPNTVPYPADVPHAVAVGGTTLAVNSDGTYNNEFWWNSGVGAGGYGISSFFPEPAYQVPFSKGAGGRSIPDVSLDADPNSGMIVCLATPEASPNCFPIGGTSMATPLWAGIWAIASQANVDAIGYSWSASSDYFYKMPDAFHSASVITAGEFSNIGLGSPIIPAVIAKGIPPVINNYTPTSGTASGGTKVTITGVGFIGVEKVTFGGVAGTHLTIESDSKLTVETPVAPAELADLQLVTPGGTAKTSPFTYVPQITGVSPNQGPLDGGTSVTITGLALSDSLQFDFGFETGAATSVKCPSSTSCTMISPAHAAGTVDIIAETPWGYGNSVANAHDKFTYQAPAITSFTPTVGATTGGVVVTIIGVGLQDGKTTISFDGVAGASVYCGSSTSCIVTSPAHPAGTVHLTATVAGAPSAASSNVFTYVVYPTITAISPNSIPANTGTVVKSVTLTITGTGFSTTAGKTVFNSGDSATVLGGVSCTSTTQCTATFTSAPVSPAAKLTTTTDAVTVTVNGITSLDSVSLSYQIPLSIPPCKGTTCN